MAVTPLEQLGMPLFHKLAEAPRQERAVGTTCGYSKYS